VTGVSIYQHLHSAFNQSELLLHSEYQAEESSLCTYSRNVYIVRKIWGGGFQGISIEFGRIYF